MVLAGARNIRNFTKICGFLLFLQFPVDFTGNHGIFDFPAEFWKTVPARSAPTRMCPDLEKPKELHRFWRGKSARGPSKSVQIKKYHHFRTLDDFLVKFHSKWWNLVYSGIFQWNLVLWRPGAEMIVIPKEFQWFWAPHLRKFHLI